MNKLLSWILLQYKKAFSPYLTVLFGNRCIYAETCSEYAMRMFKTYAFPKALFLATKRLLSCNPVNSYLLRKKIYQA